MADPARLTLINLGCGKRWVADWRNVDGGGRVKRTWLRATRALRSIGVPDRLVPPIARRYPRDVVILDLEKTPLPFATGSASVIFSQYALEYLSTAHTRRLLRDCARILAPGGLDPTLPDGHRRGDRSLSGRPGGRRLPGAGAGRPRSNVAIPGSRWRRAHEAIRPAPARRWPSTTVRSSITDVAVD